MSRIFIFKGGGQKAQQNAEFGYDFVYEIDDNSDYVEQSGVSGQSSYTNTIWHEDFETFKSYIEEWAGQQVELIRENEYDTKKETEKERLTQLKDFFSSHPAVSVSGFASEAVVSDTLLESILQGDSAITDGAWQKIEATMYKYGYR